VLGFEGRNGIVTGAGTGIGKAATLELAKAGAAVLAVGRRRICPGPVDTPLQNLSETLVNPDDPGYERRRYEVTIPMGRYGEAKEIADMVLFLLSGTVPYLTGTEIIIDGGFISG